MLLRSNFSSFPHYFIYIFLTSGVKLHIHLLNVVVQFIVFLTLSTLICQGTDISKCFSESLGIRDNESRLYFSLATVVLISKEKWYYILTLQQQPPLHQSVIIYSQEWLLYSFCTVHLFLTILIPFKIQSTPVISNSKGLTETLRNIRTSTYQS